MLMFPREHGAYSQMVLPLVTSLVVAGVTLPAVLTGLTVVLGFLAHEPLMVLLGRRGPRVRAESGAGARAMLGVIGLAMIGVGVAAIWLAPPIVRVWFALPLMPAAVVAVGVLRKQEKSGPAEIAVALAFSLASVPIVLAAGGGLAAALSLGVVFGVVFVSGVLAVRVVILKVRAGGRPRAVRVTRAALVTLGIAGAGALAVAAARGALPWAAVAAATPGILSALGIAFARTVPRLKTVGWTLMSTSTAAAIILMAGV